METAKEIAAQTGSRLKFLRDPHEAVKGAHVIYTDTWTSMGQEEETAPARAGVPAVSGELPTGERGG